MVFAMALSFWSCEDQYERVGEEAGTFVFPQSVSEGFTLTYTEAGKEMTNQDTTLTRAVVKLSAARNENYENMRFRYQVFPEGMRLEFYDDEGQMNIIEADFAMVYTDTNLIELKGNVVLTSHDGKKLEAPQMYYDRANNWIFTESSFRYTNPEDGTIMMGKGMDFDRNFTKVQAQRTDGVIVIKEEEL